MAILSRRIGIRKPGCIKAFRGNVNHVALAVQTRVQLYSTSLRVHLSLDRQRFVKMIRWGDGSLAVPLIRKAPAPYTVSSRGPAAQHSHCTDGGRAEGSARLAARPGRGSVANPDAATVIGTAAAAVLVRLPLRASWRPWVDPSALRSTVWTRGVVRPGLRMTRLGTDGSRSGRGGATAPRKGCGAPRE